MKINGEGLLRTIVGLVFMIAGAGISYLIFSKSNIGMAALFLFGFGGLGVFLFVLGILHFVRFRPPAKIPDNHLDLVLEAGGAMVDINHHIIAIGNTYDVLINNQKKYTAQTKLLTVLPEIHLSELNSSQPKYIMKKKWHYNNLSIMYDITTQDNTVLEFRTKNYWYGHYGCQAGQDYYEIFRHAGRKYSIYKNNVQIAFWDKFIVSLAEGDKFKIIADKDSNLELLAVFCLTIDNHYSSMGKGKKGGYISVDLGFSSEGVKPFDIEWRPK